MPRVADVELIEVPPGLAGVAVTTTTVGDVLGDEGYYHYRGRSAVELARSGTFEDAARLVVDGSDRPATGDRRLPAAVAALVELGDIRTGLSGLAAALALRPTVDLNGEERRADAVRLISSFPTLVASLYHRRLVEPRDDLGHTANYLWMLLGQEAAPEVVAALETYFVLTIEHGFNSGTFAARVVASTGADFGACLVAGYAALTGPRHGAVQSRVLDMLDDAAEASDVTEWMKGRIASGQRIMGIGHAVYRTIDPRATLLRDVTERIAPRRHQTAVAIEEAAARLFVGRRLGPNVDLYAASLLAGCGIPASLFTATFAVARIVGWSAHVLEQAAEPKVIRPAAYYVGPPPEF